MAEKISALTTSDGNKIYPFGQATASVPVTGASLVGLIYNFGGRVWDDNGRLSIDNNGFRQAFELLQQLQRRGWNPENCRLRDLRNLFALGQLAMYYDTSWGFTGIHAINPNARSYTASASPIAGGSGKGESNLQSHCFILLDNSPAKRDAIRLLVEYVITEDVLRDYLSGITPAYPAKRAMSSMAAVTQSTVLKGAAGSVDKVLPIPNIPALGDIFLEVCTLAQAVTVGGMDVNTAIARFRSAVTAIMQ